MPSAMAGLFGWLAKRTANTGTLRDYPLCDSRSSVPNCQPLPQ